MHGGSQFVKKIFSLGIRQLTLDEAVSAYTKSEMSISETADYHDISYGDLLIELKNRSIQILDEEIDLSEELSFLKGE